MLSFPDWNCLLSSPFSLDWSVWPLVGELSVSGRIKIQNELAGTGFKNFPMSINVMNRTLLILAFILVLAPLPLQGKPRASSEPSTPPTVLLSQHKPNNIGQSSLRVRLEQAGGALAEDDRFFQETIALEHVLESWTSPDTSKKNEMLWCLQNAAYQASRLATELHMLRAKLHEDIYPVMGFLKPNLEWELNQVLAPYEGSKTTLERTVVKVIQEIPPNSQEDSLKNTLKEGSLINVLLVYLDQHQVFFEQLQSLQLVLSKIKKRKESIVGSVYEFLDRKTGEDTDYGLFTYIIFNGQQSRNSKFLERLIASAKRASEAYQKETKHGLHIFYIPVQNRLAAEFSLLAEGDDAPVIPSGEIATGMIAPSFIAKSLVASNYDDALATDLFTRFCRSVQTSHDSSCQLSGQGPYLLTVAQPLSQKTNVNQPRLLLDFSHVEEEAFGEFIQAFKDQALGPDFPEARKVETMRLRILQVIVKAAKSIKPVGKGIKEILDFFI